MSEALYYTKCEDMPLYNYIRCQVYGDMRHMIISGQPELEDLKAAWENIASEFIELAEKSVDVYAMTVFFEAERLNAKIEVIKSILDVSVDFQCQELYDILEDEGYEVNRNPDDETAEYYKCLKKIGKRAKMLQVQLMTKQAEMTRLTKEKADGKKASVANFDNSIVILSQYNQYFINPKEVTVSQYAAMLNQYYSYVDLQKSKYAGTGQS